MKRYAISLPVIFMEVAGRQFFSKVTVYDLANRSEFFDLTEVQLDKITSLEKGGKVAFGRGKNQIRVGRTA